MTRYKITESGTRAFSMNAPFGIKDFNGQGLCCESCTVDLLNFLQGSSGITWHECKYAFTRYEQALIMAWQDNTRLAFLHLANVNLYESEERFSDIYGHLVEMTRKPFVCKNVSVHPM